jgi:predicted exporter
VTSPEKQRSETGGMVSPWRGTTPELLTAAVAVTVAAVAGYVTAGWAGLAVVAVATAAGVMVVVRGLLPQLTPDPARKAREKPRARTLTGYSYRRFVVDNAMKSRPFYDIELRPVLEHLLAARLAERHGVHLYQDPEAARRLLCRNPRDAGLWQWIDPATRPQAREGPERRGIPRHTLARLIDRLEKL